MPSVFDNLSVKTAENGQTVFDVVSPKIPEETARGIFSAPTSGFVHDGTLAKTASESPLRINESVPANLIKQMVALTRESGHRISVQELTQEYRSRDSDDWKLPTLDEFDERKVAASASALVPHQPDAFELPNGDRYAKVDPDKPIRLVSSGIGRRLNSLRAYGRFQFTSTALRGNWEVPSIAKLWQGYKNANPTEASKPRTKELFTKAMMVEQWASAVDVLDFPQAGDTPEIKKKANDLLKGLSSDMIVLLRKQNQIQAKEQSAERRREDYWMNVGLLRQAFPDSPELASAVAIPLQFATNISRRAARIAGFGDFADEIRNFSGVVEMIMQDKDKDAWMPNLNRWMRTAGDSLLLAIPSSIVAGPYGAISAFAVGEAIDSWEDAPELGTVDRLNFAFTQGVWEAMPAMFMQAMGMGGFEELLPGGRGVIALGGGVPKNAGKWANILSFGRGFAKAYTQEVFEEEVTALGQIGTRAAFVDETAMSREQLERTVQDVAGVTLLTVGGGAVTTGLARAVEPKAPKNLKEEMLQSLAEVAVAEGATAEVIQPNDPDADIKAEWNAALEDAAEPETVVEVVSEPLPEPQPLTQTSITKETPETIQNAGIEGVVRNEEALPQELKVSYPDERVIPDVTTSQTVSPADLTDKWIGDRQLSEVKADINAINKTAELKKLTQKGEKASDVDAAIAVFIDMRDSPSDYTTENIAQLTETQQALVKKAQSLTQAQQSLAMEIIAENKLLGLEGLEAGVLKNARDNYSTRIWDFGEKAGIGKAKFTISTKRARARTLTSIIDGWSRGWELQVPGAIAAQKLAHKQVSQTIHDRNLVSLGMKAGVFTLNRTDENTVRVEHPNFSKWVQAGEATKAIGPDLFVNEEGILMRRAGLWTDKKTGKYLNNALGKSVLQGIPAVDFVSKYNEVVKGIILTSSLFHHQAYLRSFILASRGINPVTAFTEGRDAILNFTPEFQEMVHAGLTIGKTQDFDPVIAQESSKIGRAIDKVPMASETRKALKALSRANTNFLFNKLGPYYKVQSALLEYRALLLKRKDAILEGKTTAREIAKQVANVINDDFGGLNLQRMGRNPTVQQLFRLFALAPDWTESNIRSMAKAFKLGDEGKVYRAMWGRIILKGVGATMIFNILMSQLSEDDDEFWDKYKESFEDGSLRWLDADVTPIFRRFGGDKGKRKYISILGHFKDPLKFITQTARSAKNKSSVLGRMVLEGLSGTDWRGKRFTSLGELIDTGNPVKWEAFGIQPISPTQYPSFILRQAEQSLPIQAQNLLSWQRGEIDGFDAITRGLGIHESATRPSKTRLGTVKR